MLFRITIAGYRIKGGLNGPTCNKIKAPAMKMKIIKMTCGKMVNGSSVPLHNFARGVHRMRFDVCSKVSVLGWMALAGRAGPVRWWLVRVRLSPPYLARPPADAHARLALLRTARASRALCRRLDNKLMCSLTSTLFVIKV